MEGIGICWRHLNTMWTSSTISMLNTQCINQEPDVDEDEPMNDEVLMLEGSYVV